MAEPSLLEALGSPCLELLPPLAAAADWLRRRTSLRTHALGVRAPIRTPAALWAAAGVRGLPGRRWPQLAGITLAAFAERIRRPPTASPL